MSFFQSVSTAPASKAAMLATFVLAAQMRPAAALTDGFVAGIVVGIVLFVLCCGGGGFYYRRRGGCGVSAGASAPLLA